MPDLAIIVPLGQIQRRILLIRGQKVMIDADLADFYGVPTKRLNEQVKRNPERFPHDFMFQLTEIEKQEVVANCDHLAKLKYSSVLPNAFTEHGALMLASVLSSPRAAEVGVYIVRAFVRLREVIAGNKVLAAKLAGLERRLTTHDRQIGALIEAMRQEAGPKPVPRKRRIGFNAESEA
jgi:hypothetical protein